MIPKEKAIELVGKFCLNDCTDKNIKKCKQYALIAIENEYYYLKEQLFNLRSCGIIESENVYLFRLQELIYEEKEVKQELEKL